jgi:hypothetical protein
MTNWLERAKRELEKTPAQATAITADTNPTAVMAVCDGVETGPSDPSIGTNGSCPDARAEKFCADRAPGLAPECSAPIRPTEQIAKETLAEEWGGIADDTLPESIRESLAAEMTAQDEIRIRGWLADIGETDPLIIAHVLERSRLEFDVRKYFLRHAWKLTPDDSLLDDRRRCSDCLNLTPRGRCLAARRKEVLANRTYKPVADLLRRCEGYAPKASDIDPRRGSERWPWL